MCWADFSVRRWVSAEWVALPLSPLLSLIHNLQSEMALSAAICVVAEALFFHPTLGQVDFYFHQSSPSRSLSIRFTVGFAVYLITFLIAHWWLQPIACAHLLILSSALNRASSLPSLVSDHASSTQWVFSAHSMCIDVHVRFSSSVPFGLCSTTLFPFSLV